MEHSDKKSTALKFAGLLGIVIPFLGAVFTASFQYWQFVLENRDNNFRQVVDKLASEKAEERQASATILGVYLRDPSYKEQALDILVSMTAIELNTNVLSAIRSSLDKLNTPQDRKLVIQNLLLQGTSIFAWKEAMKEWSKKSTTELDSSFKQFHADLASLKKDHNVSLDILPVNLIAEINDLKTKSKIQSQASRQFSEISTHEEIISGFIKSLLDNTVKNPVEGLEFFQNSVNFQAIVNAKLIDPKIINSALTSSTLASFEAAGEVSGCAIHNTTFQYSVILDSTFRSCEIRQTLFSGTGGFKASLLNTSFVDSSFEDVFFYHTNLSGADFRRVKGLKAEYFYGSMNYQSAKFDDEGFIAEIESINKSPDKFLDFLFNSTLSKSRYESICTNLLDTEELICQSKL